MLADLRDVATVIIMKKTGVGFAESPENDIFDIARGATQGVETYLAKSEYDQTVYELGRTAFYKTSTDNYVAIQKRFETDWSGDSTEKYDLILAANGSKDSWNVLATVDDGRNISWNTRVESPEMTRGNLTDTATLYRLVANAKPN